MINATHQFGEVVLVELVDELLCLVGLPVEVLEVEPLVDRRPELCRRSVREPAKLVSTLSLDRRKEDGDEHVAASGEDWVLRSLAELLSDEAADHRVALDEVLPVLYLEVGVLLLLGPFLLRSNTIIFTASGKCVSYRLNPKPYPIAPR